jgi:hypothetical protein
MMLTSCGKLVNLRGSSCPRIIPMHHDQFAATLVRIEGFSLSDLSRRNAGP